MMFRLQELLEVSLLPDLPDKGWLQGAPSAVDYLVGNPHSEEIILFTNVGQTLVHSILVPLANVSPPDGDKLQHATIDPYNHWALEHVSGGGEPDRIYLAPPVDSFGCEALKGGEQLVFRRKFDGVDKGAPRTELSQPLVQALDLYWMDEEKAFCRLNADGDVAPIIRVRDLNTHSGNVGDVLVTIDAEQLHRYMAVTEMALVMKFDFTRFRPGSFFGFHKQVHSDVSENDLFYHSGVQDNGSYANGVLIVRPVLTKDMLIATANQSWSDDGKQYAIFKAQDWKNNRLAEISCAPSALASYFEKDSDLPYQVTPAFFRPDVLQKYKANPEKYRLEHRSISARGGWYLKSYDVNKAGQVHAYLYDLAKLPYTEQLYWLSFNEWPKASISHRAFETDIKGDFSSQPDPLLDLKYEISKLDNVPPDWWHPRDEGLAATVHYPLTASPEEWSNAILALDQLVIEGFVTKTLRAHLSATGATVDKQWQSLKLLSELLPTKGLDVDETTAIMDPLRQLHHLRSKVKGHAAPKEKAELIKQAKVEHGSLTVHFRALVSNLQIAFDRIVELL